MRLSTFFVCVVYDITCVQAVDIDIRMNWTYHILEVFMIIKKGVQNMKIEYDKRGYSVLENGPIYYT